MIKGDRRAIGPPVLYGNGDAWQMKTRASLVHEDGVMK